MTISAFRWEEDHGFSECAKQLVGPVSSIKMIPGSVNGMANVEEMPAAYLHGAHSVCYRVSEISGEQI